MLASQMIYTACGKDKSGAFSVWSKSADVTKAECDEIVKVMSYRKPQNAPYEPTEEELKTLFPKKYGYFILSSGRRCIVKTTYVGKVYSDLDTRNGNFVIHAFIFNNLEDFNPFGFMKLNIFKTGLSYKEWHDSPAPDELPVVEIKGHPAIDEDAVRSLMTGSRGRHCASLLQAIIDSTTSDAVVTFNDTEENQVQIYSLLGTLLPSCYFKSATFTNQYTPQLDYTMSGSGMGAIKIRNIFPGMINTAFNYQEQLDMGNPVFYFEKGICSDIQPKRYLADIIKSLEEGSLFSVLKKIDTVNKIINETGCDIDTAIAVYHMIQKNLTWFSGADEYSKALTIALSHQYIDEQAIALNLYNDIISSGRWGRGSEMASLIKFAYTYNNQAVKDAIMEKYFAELNLFGISFGSSPISVLEQVKDNAPFHWDDFAVAVVRNPKWARYVENASAVSELFFVFDAATLAIEKNFSDADNKAGYALLVKIIKKSVTRRAFEEVELYLGAAGKLGDSAQNWLIEACIDEYLKMGVKDAETLDFVFRVICSLRYEQEKVRLLGQLVLGNMNTAFFMPTYIMYAEQYQGLFSRMEHTYKGDKNFGEFLFRKDAYVFKDTEKVTHGSLGDYFRKYYVTGFDSGVYLEKVRQYLSEHTGRSKIVESMRIYEQVRTLNDTFADVTDVLECINREIFSLPMEELIDLTPALMKDISELNNRLSAAHRTLPENYGILHTIMLIQGKLGENICRDCVQRNALYDNLTRSQLASFVDNHFNEALYLYCDYREKKYFKTDTLLVSIFEIPFDASASAKDSVIKALEKLGGKEYYEVMADMMTYAFNGSDRFASTLIIFVQRYIEEMKHGDYKKLFKKVVEIIPEEDLPAVQKYIDKYSGEHMGFFEKLFSKKK